MRTRLIHVRYNVLFRRSLARKVVSAGDPAWESGWFEGVGARGGNRPSTGKIKTQFTKRNHRCVLNDQFLSFQLLSFEADLRLHWKDSLWMRWWGGYEMVWKGLVAIRKAWAPHRPCRAIHCPSQDQYQNLLHAAFCMRSSLRSPVFSTFSFSRVVRLIYPSPLPSLSFRSARDPAGHTFPQCTLLPPPLPPPPRQDPFPRDLSPRSSRSALRLSQIADVHLALCAVLTLGHARHQAAFLKTLDNVNDVWNLCYSNERESARIVSGCWN